VPTPAAWLEVVFGDTQPLDPHRPCRASGDDTRVRELLDFEGGVIARLKLRPALH
jgi:hypothetical protein